MSSPTQRTLAHLRAAGYPLVQVVERWNPYARVRQDLFGIIDVVAVGADIVGVQATSASNVSARVAKITESEALPILRNAGLVFAPWSMAGGRSGAAGSSGRLISVEDRRRNRPGKSRAPTGAGRRKSRIGRALACGGTAHLGAVPQLHCKRDPPRDDETQPSNGAIPSICSPYA